MSFFDRLAKIFRIKGLPAPSDDFWYSNPSMPTGSGISVSEADALKYLTMFSCVSLISGDVGRLPLNLYKHRKSGGKDRITDHRLYDMLHNAPNPEMSSFLWREASQGHLLLWGNHYDFIEHKDRRGTISLQGCSDVLDWLRMQKDLQLIELLFYYILFVKE